MDGAGSVTKSQHISDPLLRPFLEPDFDPTDYLNSTLPTLSFSTTTARGRAVPLSELLSQLQTLLSQLNAQTSRLSHTLTQLTDEIIRSGSRLEYEVEVLRGETLGLNDALEIGLAKDITIFTSAKELGQHRETAAGQTNGESDNTTIAEVNGGVPSEPEFLERLRSLTTVREKLDSVVKVFGSAMQWPVAPSELSLTSSLISVSAPESNSDNRSREEKGKEHAEKLQNEVGDLLALGEKGVEEADTRVEELRTLAEVWKGTAEEKARFKQVEFLQKLIDDKQRALDKSIGSGERKMELRPAVEPGPRDGKLGSTKVITEGGSGYGFLQNLRNLKNEMYLE